MALAVATARLANLSGRASSAPVTRTLPLRNASAQSGKEKFILEPCSMMELHGLVLDFFQLQRERFDLLLPIALGPEVRKS